jgi:hypothetical protein
MSFQIHGFVALIYATTSVVEFCFNNDLFEANFGCLFSLHANFEYVEIHHEFWFFSNATITDMLKIQFHPIVNSEVYIIFILKILC